MLKVETECLPFPSDGPTPGGQICSSGFRGLKVDVGLFSWSQGRYWLTSGMFSADHWSVVLGLCRTAPEVQVNITFNTHLALGTIRGFRYPLAIWEHITLSWWWGGGRDCKKICWFLSQHVNLYVEFCMGYPWIIKLTAQSLVNHNHMSKHLPLNDNSYRIEKNILLLFWRILILTGYTSAINW